MKRFQKIIPALCFILLIGCTIGLRRFYVYHEKESFRLLADQVQKHIETNLNGQKKISDEDLQAFLRTNFRVAFFVYSNQLEKNQIGFVNTRSFDSGLDELGTFYNSHTQKETFEKIVQSPNEFHNSYLHVEDREIFQTMDNKKVNVGHMTVAFFLPGHLPKVPKSGVYYDLFYKGWMIFLAANIVIYPAFIRRKKKVIVPLPEKPTPTTPKDQLEWLEHKLNEELEEDTSRDKYETNIGWTELFNQNDLKDWHVKGEWYVKEQLAIGFPWGGSIVTKYDIPFDKYEFEIEAQRMMSHEGFVVLFRLAQYQLVWVVGGWKNTRSEVVGYPSTVTSDALEKLRWYYVKVESDGEKLVGFLDGRKLWELQKSELHAPTHDLGFQNGFGVGIWAGMSRFQRIRIVSTEESKS